MVTVTVPNLTGSLRQTWTGFGGRQMFRGLIDLQGGSQWRMDEVYGGFDENQGDVQINYYGYRFRITGWLETPLSGAEPSGQNQ
jgi:hypothetical protein